MTAPNIDMIAASLRRCSLGGSGGEDQSPPRHLAEASGESAGEITVELHSDTALPYHWEQCLDVRTGEIYYVNWETGVRTTEDPRTAAVVAASGQSSSYYCSDEDGTSDGYSCSRVSNRDDDEDENGAGDDDDDSTADSSSLSSPSPTQTSAAEDATGGESQILVAVGCKACFMYLMVPKSVDACPKCGGSLIHLGNDNGCA